MPGAWNLTSAHMPDRQDKEDGYGGENRQDAKTETDKQGIVHGKYPVRCEQIAESAGKQGFCPVFRSYE